MVDLRVLSGRARALLFAVTVFVVATVAFTGRVQQKMRDFEVYWTAGARAAAVEPLYREADGHYRFKYLPAFAVAVSPLSRLPLATAKAAWFALSLTALVGFIALSIAAIPHRSLGNGSLALANGGVRF